MKTFSLITGLSETCRREPFQSLWFGYR